VDVNFKKGEKLGIVFPPTLPFIIGGAVLGACAIAATVCACVAVHRMRRKG
jgi:hypothetical protein